MSIFKSFVSEEEQRGLIESQETNAPPDSRAVQSSEADAATVAPQPAKPATASTQAAAAPRKYGQTGIAALLRKQQESASAAASASLLPEKMQAEAKGSAVEWREPVLEDSDEDDDCEGDDEADEAEDDDDEEDEEEKPAKKKSLNDVLSIKKNTLRLGTLDAGYLRYCSCVCVDKRAEGEQSVFGVKGRRWRRACACLCLVKGA